MTQHKFRFALFARGWRRVVADDDLVIPRLPEELPAASVVIGCTSSERTIRATVDSLLGQDYPALAEVILVGDIGDSTWSALADIDDPRLIMIEHEKTTDRLDLNVKRDVGIRKSSGDVLALADPDIVVDRGWLGRSVALLYGQGGGLVAGRIRSIHDTVLGRLADSTVLAMKTPRAVRPYRVTAENFGTRGHKPPVTANAVFTRALYDSCQWEEDEECEWFRRLAKEGHRILVSVELTASKHHHCSFRQLVREYRPGRLSARPDAQPLMLMSVGDI